MAADPDTLETAEKTVLETYARQVDKLIHITINGEEIVTTDNHPFYVQGRGFIEAGNLLVGDRLVSVNGDDLTIEDYYIELTDEPVSVYNFQVENLHTYFIGDCAVWVHNKTCTPTNEQTVKEHLDGSANNAGAKNNGFINGCHEEGVLLDELIASGATIDNVTPHPDIKGVNKVEYTAQSGKKYTKTTYDSNVISTDDFFNRGMEAYAKVAESVTDGLEFNTDKSGVNWAMFIRNDQLITVYPKM